MKKSTLSLVLFALFSSIVSANMYIPTNVTPNELGSLCNALLAYEKVFLKECVSKLKDNDVPDRVKLELKSYLNGARYGLTKKQKQYVKDSLGQELPFGE